ncbi:hypothetical protein CONLIGDRAFT_113695 [Coniochaeta ligniaria NRRL 30616]|uniref:Uncharacterized protein n=1 Tax=Coniochaeta ligniaria NRRL 30616 TaxID=1408157 RepID=A0A1J7I8W7_9PEZI|nr:hypothetical protein CONLIGDRAFT_113695 [Coniochaeta ligniaria NRRL 30616]
MPRAVHPTEGLGLGPWVRGVVQMLLGAPGGAVGEPGKDHERACSELQCEKGRPWLTTVVCLARLKLAFAWRETSLSGFLNALRLNVGPTQCLDPRTPRFPS